MGRPCVFFDRDGIVNEPPDPEPYVVGTDRFRLLPDFVRVLRIVSSRGYPAVIVTNQRGIALGRMTEADVDRIHDVLQASLAEDGLTLLDIYVCPHDDDDHPWRKPNPGMLEAAARDHDLDLSASWMIGDSERDIAAGRRAGCRTIRVAADAVSTAADVHVDDMAGLVEYLEGHLPPA